MKQYVIEGVILARIKDDPTIEIPNHNEKIDNIVKAVAMAFQELSVGIMPLITSGREYIRSRKKNSKHYINHALDFSLRGLSDAQVSDLARMATVKVGDFDDSNDYDILIHGNHLHAEYDPKTKHTHGTETTIKEPGLQGLQEAKTPPPMPKVKEVECQKDSDIFVQFACAALTGILAHNSSHEFPAIDAFKHARDAIKLLKMEVVHINQQT